MPRFAALFIAAALALILLLGTPGVSGAAGESATLEKTKQQITEIKKRIGAAKGREATIAKEVKALDATISDLNRQIRVGEHDVSELESSIRTAGMQIGELEAQYKKATLASNERAIRLYKAGPTATLGRLFSSTSLIEFIRLQTFWEKSSERDGKTIIDVQRLKSELNERRDDMSRITGDLNAQRQYVAARRDLAEDTRNDRATALSQVQQQIQRDESHVKQLEEDSRKLTGVIRSSLSKSAGKEIGAASRSGYQWPLGGAVTSGYGRRRGGMHSGMDIDGNTGNPIRAAKAGRIAGVSCGGGYGICTVIDHGDGVSTLYAHQSRKAIGAGSVERGQVIGYVGCTGSCTGSHLHFEVRVNGAPRNPRSFLP